MNTLLNLQQQNSFKPISEKTELKYNQLVSETINSDLVTMLGASFVTALKKEPTAERFVKILDPLTYKNCNDNDVSHEGLRYVMAYLVYARYIGGNTVKDTFSGMVRPNRSESENVSYGHIKAMQLEAGNIATAQFKLIENFLQENSSDYPEWERGANRVSFNPRFINIRKTQR